jgi:NADH-quinone oxidoreductase subunit D
MNFFINYPFGNTELSALQRNKRLFDVKMEDGFNSRKIIETCLHYKEPLKLIPYIERIEQSSHNHYAVCFCTLIEKAAGISVDNNVQVVRTILLELERIYSHTLYLNRMFSYTDNKVLINHTITIKDMLLDCFEEICGHRMFGTGHVFGDINFNISSGNIKMIKQAANNSVAILNKIRKLVRNNPSLESLFKYTAVITQNDIIKHKVTGPFSWFKGLNSDMRKENPYLSYGEAEVQTILEPKDLEGNCVLSRIWRIMDDIDRSIKIINFLIEKHDPVYHRKEKLEQPQLNKGKYTNTIESPRGIIQMSIEVDKAGAIEAMNITSPSDTNRKMINNSLSGTLIDNVRPAFESLYLSMMEIDK